jgi:small Trp-rich protein
MWLVWLGLALVVAKYLGILGLDSVSWWWVLLPLGVAAFWFEIVERRLGLDRKKAFDEIDKAKQRRIKEALERDHATARRRRFFR